MKFYDSENKKQQTSAPSQGDIYSLRGFLCLVPSPPMRVFLPLEVAQFNGTSLTTPLRRRRVVKQVVWCHVGCCLSLFPPLENEDIAGTTPANEVDLGQGLDSYTVMMQHCGVIVLKRQPNPPLLHF